MTCASCGGCGKVADTPDREPWSAWENLPLKSAGAVLMGLVKPIPCYPCFGTGLAAIRGTVEAVAALNDGKPTGNKRLDRMIEEAQALLWEMRA